MTEVTKHKPRIRVVSSDDIVSDAKILYVTLDDDGQEVETDISSCVQTVDVRLHVGELARANVGLIFVDSDTRAEINEVVLKVVPPSAIPGVIDRLQEQLARAAAVGIVETTNVADSTRTYDLSGD